MAKRRSASARPCARVRVENKIARSYIYKGSAGRYGAYGTGWTSRLSRKSRASSGKSPVEARTLPGIFPFAKCCDEALIGLDTCTAALHEGERGVVGHMPVPDEIRDDDGGGPRDALHERVSIGKGEQRCAAPADSGPRYSSLKAERYRCGCRRPRGAV